MNLLHSQTQRKEAKKNPYEPQSGQFPQQFPIKSQQIPIKSQEIIGKFPSNHNKFRRNSVEIPIKFPSNHKFCAELSSLPLLVKPWSFSTKSTAMDFVKT